MPQERLSSSWKEPPLVD